MASPVPFIRNTPAELLRDYFIKRDITLADEIEWSQSGKPGLIRAVRNLKHADGAKFSTDIDRVAALANEAGQIALYETTGSKRELDALPSTHARALWSFLHEHRAFKRAEEIRYTDDYRRTRRWTGFCGPAGAEVRQHDAAAIEAFKQAVRSQFDSRNVHVDIFERRRAREGRDDVELIQATVYLEGKPDQALEFVDGELDLRDRRPVIEAALTFEPLSGSIEVVAADRTRREELVRVFTRTLLGTEIDGAQLPVRSYDLEVLKRPFSFPTDAADAIRRVRVNSLRLRPLDTGSQRVTLECLSGAEQTIWQAAEARFGDHDPLANGWVVSQARLTIAFEPPPGSRSEPKLPITITWPHGCDLKERTERERLIGEKYLRQWGIRQDL